MLLRRHEAKQPRTIPGVRNYEIRSAAQLANSPLHEIAKGSRMRVRPPVSGWRVAMPLEDKPSKSLGCSTSKSINRFVTGTSQD